MWCLLCYVRLTFLCGVARLYFLVALAGVVMVFVWFGLLGFDVDCFDVVWVMRFDCFWVKVLGWVCFGRFL